MKRIAAAATLAPPILFVIQAVTAGILLPPMPPPEGSGLGPVVLSTVLTALVLITVAVGVAVGGLPRIAILFLVGAGIPANNLVEAVFFSLDIPRSHLGPLFLHTFAVAALFAIILDRLAGPPAMKVAISGPRRSPAAWATRTAVCDLVYVVLYFAAGVLVWPFVRDFYSSRPLPGTGHVLLMQVFRGLVFTGISLALARFLAWSRGWSALLVGVTLSILGGIAPLMVPNPYMPTAVRLPHLAEVGVSNLLFGLFAGWLLGRVGDPKTAPAQARTAA